MNFKVFEIWDFSFEVLKLKYYIKIDLYFFEDNNFKKLFQFKMLY